MPKVSVIVPIFRVEHYIERCVRSLMEQSLDDIEYIFVDDASPDNSMSILERTLNEYPQRTKVKIFRNHHNLGQALARRRGIMEATGEYVIHCDPDDWVEHDMYETLYHEAEERNHDIVWCDYYLYAQGRRIACSQESLLTRKDVIRSLLSNKISGSLWNRLVRRSIVQDKSIRWPEKNLIEDLVLVLQYYLHSSSFDYISYPLYNYNQDNTDSITTSGTDRARVLKNAKDYKVNLEMIIDILRSNQLLDVYSCEVEFLKFISKSFYFALLDTAKDCREWRACFPEINFSLFSNPLISKGSKQMSFLALTSLYPLCKFIKHKIGK